MYILLMHEPSVCKRIKNALTGVLCDLESEEVIKVLEAHNFEEAENLAQGHKPIILLIMSYYSFENEHQARKHVHEIAHKMTEEYGPRDENEIPPSSLLNANIVFALTDVPENKIDSLKKRRIYILSPYYRPGELLSPILKVLKNDLGNTGLKQLNLSHITT